jgi:hypothetical protein
MLKPFKIEIIENVVTIQHIEHIDLNSLKYGCVSSAPADEAMRLVLYL